MTGWHYTCASNLPSIRKRGLIPYVLNKWCFSPDQKGIMLFDKRQNGEGLLGVLLHKLNTTSELRFAELRVVYEKGERLGPTKLEGGDEFVAQGHNGSVGKWIYHKHEPLTIITEPTRNFTIERRFDLLAMIRKESK